MNPISEALDRIMDTEAAQQERARKTLRLDTFTKVGAELYLERHSDDMALVRLNIGHLSFGIGQPRNGTEAASVLRTFRDALTDLLMAASGAALAWRPIETAPEDTNMLVATHGGYVDTAFWTDEDGEGRKWWWLETANKYAPHPIHADLQPTHWMPLPKHPQDFAAADLQLSRNKAARRQAVSDRVALDAQLNGPGSRS